MEIAKIVGTICLFFGISAALLVWFSDSTVAGKENPPAKKEKPHSTQHELIEKSREAKEVYLGRYSTMRGSVELAQNNPQKEGVRVVEFEIAGLMRGSQDRVIHFERGLDQYYQRVKQAMTEIARGATEQELADPGTVTLRGRICNKLNSMFGDNIFDDVVFYNFRVYDL